MTHSEDIYYIRCTKGLEQHRNGCVGFNYNIHFTATTQEWLNCGEASQYTRDDASHSDLGTFYVDYRKCTIWYCIDRDQDVCIKASSTIDGWVAWGRIFWNYKLKHTNTADDTGSDGKVQSVGIDGNSTHQQTNNNDGFGNVDYRNL